MPVRARACRTVERMSRKIIIVLVTIIVAITSFNLFQLALDLL
ncbi:hypothetical protein QP028_05850 [Corynebacterium suedekumii]|nr:hypothetical protein QP028_05850 [Corynebacterium suedekumii]